MSKWTSSMPKCWFNLVWLWGLSEKISPAIQEESDVTEPSPQIAYAEESVSPNRFVLVFSLRAADSLNKFKSKKNYFQGEAHSLRSSESSTRSSGNSLRTSSEPLSESNSAHRSSAFALRSANSPQPATAAGRLRKSEPGPQQSASESRFEEIDKEHRFQGVGHRLKWEC